MTQPNAAIADPVLGGLDALFPEAGAPDCVLELAGTALGGRVAPGQARVDHVRYRPTKNCVVLWSLARPAGPPILVSGKLFRGDRGATAVRRSSFLHVAERDQAAGGKGGSSCRYCPEHHLLLQVYPLDLRLPGLPQAASADWAREALAPLAGVAPEGVTRVDPSLVSYKPWRRGVFRYSLRGQARHAQVFGKVFRDDRGQGMAPRLQALRAHLEDASAPWGIPEALGYLPAVRMLVVGGVDASVEVGGLVKQACADPTARATLRECMARAAEGLAHFQRAEVGGVAFVPPARLLDNLARGMDGLAAVAPALAACAKGQLADLEAEAARLRPEAMAPSHGAYRHDQFVLSGSRLVALDLDTLCVSGASADAGNFLAYLDVTALRRPRIRPVIEECAETFAEATDTHRIGSEPWVGWHRRAGHVKKVLRTFYSLDRRWPEIAERLLSPARERV